MLVTLALLGILLPTAAAPVAAADPSVPAGFADRLVWGGLTNPTAVVFSPDGSMVYVAQKNGQIKEFDGLTDSSATLTTDLSSDVFNYWDRGLLGLAIDPKFDTGRPYLYALYTYNHRLDPPTTPAWPDGGLSDACPSVASGGPGGNTNGCDVSGRLERLTVDLSSRTVSARKVLITDWCQQYPSHSIGALAFGPEGALYVSAGDGASFNEADYGQLGRAYYPADPCADPTDEGGALRSQDLQTSGDPVGLDGTVLRIDPDTGAAWPDNANAGSSDENKARIIAYGLRNPFRLTIRPNGSVWLGDVGWDDWEEIDKIPDPDAAPRDFGWPCYEGDAAQPSYASHDLPICEGLTSQTEPAFAYNHRGDVVSGDGCDSPAGSAVAGLAFHGTGGAYPSQYEGLFFTDWARACIWFTPLDGNGEPDFGQTELFDRLNPADSTKGGAVYLGVTPAGDLIYTNLNAGEVRTITYGDTPVAVFTATPRSGLPPLNVTFNASGSSDPNGQTLTYAWDLDGDGAYDDSTLKAPTRTYTGSASVDVGLKVTDPDGHSDTVAHRITLGSTAPVATIDAPTTSVKWAVGDEIAFSGHASDAQDGVLPASAYEWTLVVRHCPSACHEHAIQTWDGVTSGTFEAPSHPYPSSLRLELKVTDSTGLSTVKSVELQPRTGTVIATSDPAGIPLEVNGGIGIVGGPLDVSAPASIVLGEETWAFDGWSDGGARDHTITVNAGTNRLTASFAVASSADAPDTCSAAATGGPADYWRYGRLASGTDVDWYRFTVSSTRTMRIVLGDLPADASLKLYKGCTTYVTGSDASGTTPDEIFKSLSPGTYAVRVAAKGTASGDPYSLLIQQRPSGLSVQSFTTTTIGSTLFIVGEVWNEYSTTRGPISVTARLYDDAGNVLSTWSTKTVLYAKTRTRAPFHFHGIVPAGFASVSFSLSSPVSSKTYRSVSITDYSVTKVGGFWRATGHIKASHGSVRSLAMALTLYDSRMEVVDVVKGKVGTTKPSSGKTTSFTATSTRSDIDVARSKIRAFGFKP